MIVGMVGAGSWGTTLAVHLALLGNSVLLWGHGAGQRQRLRDDRQNRAYLPGVPLSSEITIVDDVIECTAAPVVVIATPTQSIRATLAVVPIDELQGRVVVSVSKGIERGSLLRISQLMHDTHRVEPERFVALSGPSHAEEVAEKIPTLVVAASPSTEHSRLVQSLFTSETLRVYTSPDLVGVELGASLKNVIAVAAGIIDGLGMGDNTKAALITRGLAEIRRMGVVLGADAETFSGLSGLGDLVVTCTSRHSRNRHVGEQIGRGRTLQDIENEMSMVAEGVSTTDSALRLAQRSGVEVPIIQQVHQILFHNKPPREAIYDLMTRESKQEIWS